MKKVLFIVMLALVMTAGSFASAAPQAPGSLVLTSLAQNSVYLSWQSVPGAIGYYIYRNNSVNYYAATTITNFTDTGLSDDTTYTYHVAAYDSPSSISQLSNAAVITINDVSQNDDAPSIPKNLYADAISSSRIDLSWSRSTDDDGVEGYRVYRDGVLIASPTNNYYSDTGLNSATKYSYRVSAIDEDNNVSAKCDAVEERTLAADNDEPSMPKNLLASPVSSSRIDLSWSRSTDDDGVEGYRVYRDGVLIASPTNNYYSDTGLNSATKYSYRVSAVDEDGNSSEKSGTAEATTLSSNNVPVEIIAKIAIKNGKSNLINLKSNEQIKIVVYSTGDLDATKIDKKTAYFGGALANAINVKDENKDGRKDIILNFRAKEMKDLANGDKTALLTAKLTSGEAVGGQISVNVKNAIKKNNHKWLITKIKRIINNHSCCQAKTNCCCR